MSYSRQVGTVTLDVNGVPVTFEGVTFYPAVPATQTDPADGAFVEWDAVKIGGVDVRDALIVAQIDYFEDRLIAYLEN